MCKYSTLLVREKLDVKYEAVCKQSATNPEKIAELLCMLGLDKSPNEQFWVVHFNSQMKVIGVETVSIGSIRSSSASARDVFRSAILSNAAAVILAHNHPSGDPAPSESDKVITDKLKEAGDILDISVLDHIVIGEDCYYSFKETGIM